MLVKCASSRLISLCSRVVPLRALPKMKMGRSIRFDPVAEKIIDDDQAARLATPQYRDPWKFPAAYLA